MSSMLYGSRMTVLLTLSLRWRDMITAEINRSVGCFAAAGMIISGSPRRTRLALARCLACLLHIGMSCLPPPLIIHPALIKTNAGHAAPALLNILPVNTTILGQNRADAGQHQPDIGP